MTCVGFVPLPKSSDRRRFAGDHDDTQPLAESELPGAFADAFALTMEEDPPEAEETPEAPEAPLSSWHHDVPLVWQICQDSWIYSFDHDQFM